MTSNIKYKLPFVKFVLTGNYAEIWSPQPLCEYLPSSTPESLRSPGVKFLSLGKRVSYMCLYMSILHIYRKS